MCVCLAICLTFFHYCKERTPVTQCCHDPISTNETTRKTSCLLGGFRGERTRGESRARRANRSEGGACLLSNSLSSRSSSEVSKSARLKWMEHGDIRGSTTEIAKRCIEALVAVPPLGMSPTVLSGDRFHAIPCDFSIDPPHVGRRLPYLAFALLQVVSPKL